MRNLVAFWLLLLVATAAAAAQTPPPEDRTPRRVPVNGYTLALSWTPEYCHGRGARAASDECALPVAKGFTLRGLWPDGADPKAWPQYCRATAPLTPAELRAGSTATPSSRLLQHEWDKHGSCMAASASAYFAEEQRLYRDIRTPDMRALAAHRDLTARQMREAFAAANPGMSAAMVRLDLNRRGWLEGVWLCFGLDKRPRACPAGADPMPASTRVRVQAAA